MFNLVLGRSGSGKTEYCRNLLGDKARSGNTNLLLIVPEQFSYSTERALLEKLGPQVANNIEVLSFTRLADFINRKVGGISGAKLDDADEAILLLHTLNDIQDSLEYYNLQADKTYFTKDLLSLFSEFRKQQISTEDFKQTKNNTLNKKLKDIKLIFDEFNSLLELNEYTDDALTINQVIKAIKENDILSNYTICIDAFKGFTGQELSIINQLVNKAGEVTITLPYDEDDSSMIFGAVKDTLLHLPVSDTKTVLTGKRTENKELLFLEKNIFSSNQDKYEEKTNSITLFEADTKYDECNFIAAQIRKLQREENLRLNDIAIVTRHENNYKAELIAALKRYNIEIFEDKRQPIATQPLIVYCKAILSLLTKKDLNTKDILSLLKTGLTPLSEEECLKLENYAFVWNIQGAEWQEPFVNISRDAEEELIEVNCIREKLIAPIQELKSKIAYDCKVKSLDTCRFLYEYLEKIEIRKQLLSYAKALDETDFSDVATEQNRIWELFTEILNKLATIQGDDPITITMFYELFLSVCDMATLGTLPHGLDELTIGSADRIRLNNPKVVFVCGCIEGEFPENVKSSNLLTSNDRKILSNELDLSLSLSNELAACDERFMAYSALTSSIDKLFVSYHNKAGASETLSPSVIYSDIKERFTNVKKIKQSDLDPYFFSETKESTFNTFASGYHKRSAENVVQYNTLKGSLEGNKEFDNKFNILETILKDEPKEIKNKELALKLFGEHIGLSASRIETYYSCPFSYFCRYGLGVYPIRRVSLDSQLRGTVIHYVLEQILKQNSKETFQSFTEKEQEAEIEKYLKQYLGENYNGNALKDANFKYNYNSLTRTLKDVISRMIEEFKSTEFEPIEFEYDIKDTFDKASIKGDIDRVDRYVAADGKTYIRIVDYKSYKKQFNLDHIIKGLSLQMLLYLFAAKKQLSSIPAGIFYYKASSMNMSINDRGLSDDAVFEKKISENVSYGLYLDDSEILGAMEEGQGGRFFKFDEESLVSLEELGRIEEAVNDKVNQMVSNLQNGLIPIYPTFEKGEITGCKYCDYSHVCGFEGDPTKLNVIKDLKKSKVMELLAGGGINE